MSAVVSKQSGFIVLLAMLALVLGAMSWFASASFHKHNLMRSELDNQYIHQLDKIKERMLAYAVMHPEIYSNAATVVPGPGYFPCPDVDGDGTSDTPCGRDGADDQLFVIGKVPDKISSRNVSFIDSNLNRELFWYAFDSRFVQDSQLYSFSTSSRFAPLNSNLPTTVTQSSSAECPPDPNSTNPNSSVCAPFYVDGEDEIVMIIFYAGDPLQDDNRPSNDVEDYLEQPNIQSGFSYWFTTSNNSLTSLDSFNDYAITITRAEWEAAVLARVSRDINPADSVPDLCVDVLNNGNAAIDSTDPYPFRLWFNECSTNGAGAPGAYNCPQANTGFDNLAGQGWRTIVCS